MFRSSLFFGVVILFLSCADKSSSSQNLPSASDEAIKNVVTESMETLDSLSSIVDTSQAVSNLIDVTSLNKEIQVELKYTTVDNFMRMQLYTKTNKAYLQKDVAERLAKVQSALSKKKPGYRLLIYDALRPVSVQRKMWNALDSIPPSRRGKFVSNPDKRSLHNMGAAVDLTIIDDNGNPLDMGAGFDDIREIAYPSLEEKYLNLGELKPQQVENRLLLRRLMQAQGFRQLETEWWHFNACSRIDALKKYKVLHEEF